MNTRACIISAMMAVAFGAAALTPRQEIAAMPEKAGGVYYAYPVTTVTVTPPPAGFEPFYISHYGRHGSRYLISDNDYQSVIDVMRRAADAGALTPMGLDVLCRLDSVFGEAQGRGGELTPLGTRQHKAIAHRMIENYPEVFSADARVTACSTVVMRCAHSMFAFIEGLKEVNPALQVPRESSNRNMHFLNYHSAESGKYSSDKGPWDQDYKRFQRAKVNPARLMSLLFADAEYLRRYVDQEALMWGLYWVAVDMQNMETKLSFFDIFTTDELADLWEVINFSFYATNSSYPLAEGQHVINSRNLVADIITRADQCIADGGHGAALRFGHDGNIVPLTAILGLDGCYGAETEPERVAQAWVSYKISPMASNVQIVLYRNAAGEVIAKVLHNERETAVPEVATDMFPFYKWDDLKTYWSKK